MPGSGTYLFFPKIEMKTVFLGIFLVFFTLDFAFSQVVILPVDNLVRDYSGQIRSTVGKTGEGIDGTPFVFDDYVSGIVYPSNKKDAFNVMVNINSYSDMFEISVNDNKYEMPNHSFDSVKIGVSKFIPVNQFKDDRLTVYTMQVLGEDRKGNYLVKEYVINLLDAQAAKAYQQPRPATYQLFPPKYYFYESEERKLIPLNTFRVLKKDVDKPEELRSFLKENRINKRDVTDLQKLFNFVYQGD